MFRLGVHLVCSYLHLEGVPIAVEQRGVQGLVTIGLGGLDVIVVFARYPAKTVVKTLDDVATLLVSVHQDANPDGIERQPGGHTKTLRFLPCGRRGLDSTKDDSMRSGSQ